MHIIQFLQLASIVLLGTMLFDDDVFAGTTGSEFQPLYNKVNGWSSGYLGKTIAVGVFIVGGVTGMAKQTAMPALVGIVFAIVLGLGPTIIGSIMTATV